MKTEESGVSHAAVMVKANTMYNLISTDPSQAFSAYLHTTFQKLNSGYQYTKGVNIGHIGELVTLYYFDRKDEFFDLHLFNPECVFNSNPQALEHT